MWRGDSILVLENLVLKDFRIRYRNMSLGVLWSVLNPIVMMGVLTFVFTMIFPNPRIKNYPVFVLCGLVPYSFFTVAWIAGTTSVVDSVSLVKRVPMPREIVPLSAVLSNTLHLLIQVLLLVTAVLGFGGHVNVYWLWLPVIWLYEIVFVCGLSLITSTINVYIRDTRYVVESVNTVLFWLVPIFYGFEIIPRRYQPVFEINPVAALVICLRKILLEGVAPARSTLVNLSSVAFVTLAVGVLVFRKGKRAFYEHI